MNAIQTHFWAVRDYLAPVLRESKFKEHGRITPEEFVAAGDFLSYKFPTWSWSSGEGSKTRDFLPKDKQYLISKGIPCLRRVSQMEQGAVGGRNRKKSSSKGAKVTADEKLLSFAEGSNGAEGTGGEDDWLATHIDDQGDRMDRAEVGDIDDIPDGEGEGEGDAGAPPSVRMSAGEVDDLASQVAGTGIAPGQSQDGAEDGNDGEVGDIPDMDDEDEDELGAMAGAGVVEQEDPTNVAPAAPSVTNETATPDNSTRNNILSVRTYDCLITYDKYYQTPRMWLVGYDEHGQPLKPSQIFEDVSSDYAQKTVTIEPFPHSKEGWSTASIHPCKHASVMRKVIERMDRGVKEEQRKLKQQQQQQQQTLSPQEQGGTPAPGEDDPTTEPTSTTTAEAKSAKKKKWGLGGAMKKVAASRSTSHGNAQQQQRGDDASGGATMTRHASGPMAGQEETAMGEVSGSSAEAEEGLRVDQYLLVFLKFMASIVPAIEIDATQSF